MRKKHLAKVERGKLSFYDKNSFLVDLGKYEGKDVGVILEARRKSRSSNQNAYYWAVIVEMLSQETGYTKNEMHEVLKYKFLRVKRRIEKEGKVFLFEYVRSTTELSTIEFEEYCAQVRMWASMPTEQDGLGLYIPDPNEGIMDYGG